MGDSDEAADASLRAARRGDVTPLTVMDRDQTLVTSSYGTARGTLFAGLSLHLHGYTDPSHLHLRKAIVQYGGKVIHVYRRSVDIIICTRVTERRFRDMFKEGPCVLPVWVLDCIKCNALLPYDSTYAVPSPTLNKCVIYRVIPTKDGADMAAPSAQSPKVVQPVIQEVPEKVAGVAIMPKDFFEQSRLHHLNAWKMHFSLVVKQVLLPLEGERRWKWSKAHCGAYHEQTVLPALRTCSQRRSAIVNVADRNRRLALYPFKQPLTHVKKDVSTQGSLFNRDGDGTGAARTVKSNEGTARGVLPAGKRLMRVIAHVDMDCFFVSVGVRRRPQYKMKPTCVSHAAGHVRVKKGVSDMRGTSEGQPMKGVPAAAATTDTTADAAGPSSDGDDTVLALLESSDDMKCHGSDDDAPGMPLAGLSRVNATSPVGERHETKANLVLGVMPVQAPLDSACDEAVTGHVAGSSSDIASANYAARKYGVRNGMWAARAIERCPDLLLLPYEFAECERVACIFFSLMCMFSPKVYVGSVDEAKLELEVLVDDSLSDSDVMLRLNGMATEQLGRHERTDADVVHDLTTCGDPAIAYRRVCDFLDMLSRQYGWALKDVTCGTCEEENMGTKSEKCERLSELAKLCGGTQQARELIAASIPASSAWNVAARSGDSRSDALVSPYECWGVYNSIESCLTSLKALRTLMFALTGCTCSVGVGPSLLAASIALKEAKPDGFAFMDASRLARELGDMELSMLPTVGYRVVRVIQNGIRPDLSRVNELRRLKDAERSGLLKLLGRVRGTTILQYAAGEDTRPFPQMEERKHMSVNLNYGLRMKELPDLLALIRNLCIELRDRMVSGGARTSEGEYSMRGMPSYECRSVGVNVLLCHPELRLYEKQYGTLMEATKHMGHGRVEAASADRTLPSWTCDVDTFVDVSIALVMDVLHRKDQADIRHIRGLSVKCGTLRVSQVRSPPFWHVLDEAGVRLPQTNVGDKGAGRRRGASTIQRTLSDYFRDAVNTGSSNSVASKGRKGDNGSKEGKNVISVKGASRRAANVYASAARVRSSTSKDRMAEISTVEPFSARVVCSSAHKGDQVNECRQGDATRSAQDAAVRATSATERRKASSAVERQSKASAPYRRLVSEEDVDPDVFDELPADVQAELQAVWNMRRRAMGKTITDAGGGREKVSNVGGGAVTKRKAIIVPAKRGGHQKSNRTMYHYGLQQRFVKQHELVAIAAATDQDMVDSGRAAPVDQGADGRVATADPAQGYDVVNDDRLGVVTMTNLREEGNVAGTMRRPRLACHEWGSLSAPGSKVCDEGGVQDEARPWWSDPNSVCGWMEEYADSCSVCTATGKRKGQAPSDYHDGPDLSIRVVYLTMLCIDVLYWTGAAACNQLLMTLHNAALQVRPNDVWPRIVTDVAANVAAYGANGVDLPHGILATEILEMPALRVCANVIP